jgi:hypothetical protein
MLTILYKDKMMNNDTRILKYKLEQLLRDNIMEISFTKVDGTERRMKCTLKSTIIPTNIKEEYSDEELQSVTRRVAPENVMPVWDVEKNGWRSFRVDRVSDYITLKNEA